MAHLSGAVVSGRADRTTSRPRSPPSPLLLPAGALALGIWASHILGPLPGGVRWALLVGGLLLAAGLLVPRHPRVPWARMALGASAALVGLLRHQQHTTLAPDHVAHLVGDQPRLTRLEARVQTQPLVVGPQKYNRYLPFDPPARTRMLVAAEALLTTSPPTPVRGLVRVQVDGVVSDLVPGDRVVLTGRLYRPAGPRNPGEVDWAYWNRLQGVYAGLALEGPQYASRLPGPAPALGWLMQRIRTRARQLLLEPGLEAGEDAAQQLLSAMVLGQRSATERAVDEAFMRTGVIHFLSVSGSHMAILVGAAWLVARGIPRSTPRSAAAVTLALVLAYALLAEPNAPFLRSAIMCGLWCVAAMSGRPGAWVNWLALAGAAILLTNPDELLRVGFQLSFVQVLALALVAGPLLERATRPPRAGPVPPDPASLAALALRRARNGAIGLGLVCIIAWVASAPLVLLHFGRFAPLAPLHSFILTVPISMIILLGFFTMLCGTLLPPLGSLLAGALHHATAALLRLVSALAEVPGSVIDLSSPPAWLVLATYAILLALIVTWRWPALTGQQPLAPRAAAGSALGALTALPAAWCAWLALMPQRAEGHVLHVLDVASGSANLVATANGHAAVVDLGTNVNRDAGELAIQAMRALRIRRLDLLAISHADFDHFSGVPRLLARHPPGTVWINPYCDAATVGLDAPAAGRAPALPPVHRVHLGRHLDLGSAGIDVLWPPADRPALKVNDTSLVLRLTLGGVRVLLCGDIEDAALRELIDRHDAGHLDLRCQVLVAPHHGSVLPHATADFYRRTAARAVVISSGRPRPETAELVQRVLGPECRIVNTHDVGCVVIRVPPAGSWRVETPFAPRRH